MDKRLRAGPLTAVLADGELKYVRLGAHEVLRRVYAAVRDERWGTVPAALSNLEITGGDDATGAAGFTVTFDAEHRDGPIHFRWKGAITGDASGTLTYRMDGVAETSFVKNRIGVCVLHPVDECAGRACRIEHGDGRVTEGRFPHLISPHQPFFDVRAISHEVIPGVRADVRLEGETFEMEDHRNWSDQSFKTYGTPLAAPRPVTIDAGTRVVHTLTLSLSSPSTTSRGVAVRPNEDEVVFQIDSSAAPQPMPALGISLGASELGEAARARVRALQPAHLRVDVTPSLPGWQARLAAAEADALAIGAPLELALCLGEDADREAARVADHLRALRAEVWAHLVLPLNHDVTAPDALRAARARIEAVAPGAIFGAGSNLNFTEVNRNREVVEGADVVCFPNNPQVHGFDDETIAESPEAIDWIAETARSFCGGRPLVMSAVTLKGPPRPAPHVRPLDAAARADRRQTSKFLGAWTVVHVGHVARSGFARATYFEATGPLGLMSDDVTLLYPVYHALASVAWGAGGEIRRSISSRPLVIDGVALRRAGEMRIVLGNLTATPQSVRIEGLPLPARIERAGASAALDGARGAVVRLDSHEIVTVVSDPR